jgi:hypothetical protein
MGPMFTRRSNQRDRAPLRLHTVSGVRRQRRQPIAGHVRSRGRGHEPTQQMPHGLATPAI